MIINHWSITDYKQTVTGCEENGLNIPTETSNAMEVKDISTCHQFNKPSGQQFVPGSELSFQLYELPPE